MKPAIDLNADLGEGGGQDELLLPLVSSANIACGGHAGNEETMRRTITAAMASGTRIGAHPGYEDPANFGRLPLAITPAALRQSILTQLSRFLCAANHCGASIDHVKPHGALYNQADTDMELAALLVECTTEILPTCRIYCPPHGALSRAAANAGLPVVPEGFADRRYRDDGTLVPRGTPGAVLSDPSEAAAQAVRIAGLGQVVTEAGTTIPLQARTLCVHGDTPHSVAVLQAVRTALADAGIHIQSP